MAVIGGGPAGLTAAYELVSRHPQEYEVTVYQMGWRVGGKGTSGYRRWTPPGASEPVWNRIEEHGLHILFGFYDTVFNVMSRVFDDVRNDGMGGGIASFEDAFLARDLGSVTHRRRSRWNIWSMPMPRNTRLAGAAPAGEFSPVDPGDLVRTIVHATVSSSAVR